MPSLLEEINGKLDRLLEQIAAPERRFFSVEEAAAFSGLSTKSVRRLLSSGTLTAFRPVRGRILLDRRELEAVIVSSARRRIIGGRGKSRDLKEAV